MRLKQPYTMSSTPEVSTLFGFPTYAQSFCLLTTLAAAGAGLFLLALKYHNFIIAGLKSLRPLPNIRTVFPFEDHVWTSGASAKADDAVVPWKLTVSDDELQDLKERLQKTRYGKEMEGQNFDYGFPADQLRKIVDHWLHKFDWKKQEEFINQYDHFKTVIEGLNIHFVHVRPVTTNQTVRVLPVVLFHGWPGSFFELYKLIPLLTTPRQIGNEQVVFEAVIPSLPGYGFSDGAQKPGLSVQHIGRIMKKLMTRLKIEKFYVHGGDWGSIVARTLSTMYPEHVAALNLTMYPMGMPVSVLKDILRRITPAWLADPPAQIQRFPLSTFPTLLQETGYFHIQATKPDTVGAALLNDPAGLAAYILEKFSTATNVANIKKADGGLTENFTMDDLLTNVMIYWISGSMITAMRLYKETFAGGMPQELDGYQILVPTLLSDFPNEAPGFNPPDAVVTPYFKDLIGFSRHEAGGHFAAMERPKDVANDVFSMARTILSRG